MTDAPSHLTRTPREWAVAAQVPQQEKKMDKPVEFYELTKVTIQPPKPGEFAFATAALTNCKLCGTCIDGMEGPGESICIKCGDELKAGRHAARARVRLHAAAKCAVEHIEHMAKWISAKGDGYSFESLGEDIAEIRAAIDATEDQSGPIVVDIGEALKLLQAAPELATMMMTTLMQSVSAEDLAAELQRRSASAPLPVDVVELVIAARIVAFEDQSPEALKQLDKASEAFADRVPWDDEPHDAEGGA